MVTPTRRWQAVEVLEDEFVVPQRRACRVVGQPRSTQRLAAPVPAGDEAVVRAWLRAFSKRRPRWGWRRAAKGLRDEGHRINDKGVRRLWRDDGLRVPYRKPKKRLVGIGVAIGAVVPICPNALWAIDFQFDTTADRCTIKMLNIIDEYTRECLAIVVDRSIDADHVVAVLDRLCVERGTAPAFVRLDGPKFVSQAIVDWYQFLHVDAVFIGPGSPWQNTRAHVPMTALDERQP